MAVQGVATSVLLTAMLYTVASALGTILLCIFLAFRRLTPRVRWIRMDTLWESAIWTARSHSKGYPIPLDLDDWIDHYGEEEVTPELIKFVCAWRTARLETWEFLAPFFRSHARGVRSLDLGHPIKPRERSPVISECASDHIRQSRQYGNAPSGSKFRNRLALDWRVLAGVQGH